MGLVLDLVILAALLAWAIWRLCACAGAAAAAAVPGAPMRAPAKPNGETIRMTDTIRLYGLVTDSIVDGPGFRTSIFTQGCPHHCPRLP